MSVAVNTTLNAFEVVEMAEQIEKNGAKFYRKAAENAADVETAQTFLQLAAMEENHLKVFANMRKELLVNERKLVAFDPISEIAQYLQALANGHVFDLKKYDSGKLTGSQTVKDVLKMALDAEKDSIIFYLGLKEVVSEEAGRDRIESIIKEEMGHISILNNRLTALK